MRRREFIAGLWCAMGWPCVAWAQRRLLPTIGWLHAWTPEAHRAFMPAFHQGLAEIGFVEGRNVAIEHLSAEGHQDLRQALAADVVRRNAAVIVTDTTAFAQTARAATQTVPIVFATAGADPIEFGLVASLNHPGGNATGVAVLGIELTSKRLDLLHKLVPAANPIAALVSTPDNRFGQNETRELQSAARSLGIRVLMLNASTQRELVTALAASVDEKAGALLIGANIFLQEARDQIISFAARHAIPAMFWDSASAAAGALSSYGPDFTTAYYQAGVYVGRILKGEKPADLPVVQPNKFKLVFNLKAARAMGLEIPPGLVALADEIIE